MIFEAFLVLLLLAFAILGIACLQIAYIHRLYAHIPGPPLDRFVYILRHALREQKYCIICRKKVTISRPNNENLSRCKDFLSPES